MLPLYSLRNISYNLQDKRLLNQIDLHFYAGEKIAIIGNNGTGKSTLLKLMAGKITPDEGEIFIQPGAKIGYLVQDTNLHDDKEITIYEYILGNKLEDKYLLDQFLDPLSLDGERNLQFLSGGKIRRVELCKTLYNNPEILLLDEPTNHLDLQAIEWLEQYLMNFEGLVITISHDRQFLEKITNNLLYLDRGNYYYHNQGFKDFDNFLSDLEAKEQEALRKTKRKLEQEEHWLKYGVTARRKRNQQRLANLKALRDKIKADRAKLSQSQKQLSLSNEASQKQAKIVIDFEDITIGFEDATPPKIITKNFSCSILKGERVGIIGHNGAGKSTLIKSIIGELKPIAGAIYLAPNLHIAYMDQKREQLNYERTIWQNLYDLYGDYISNGERKEHLHSYLKRFLFEQKQYDNIVKTLSGGEQNRLLMAMALARPADLLILDEPTNDLDLQTLELLEEFLANYKGTILVVSHDRQFINNLVTRIIIVDEKQTISFIGGYDDFIDYNKVSYEKSQNTKKMVNYDNNNKKSVKIKTKLSYKEQRDLEILPTAIEKLTKQIDNLNKQILEITDVEKQQILISDLANLQSELEDKEECLLELMILDEELAK
jgi:ATP-binding cassette subfamily F protein uup